jgi:hypothetical protein
MSSTAGRNCGSVSILRDSRKTSLAYLHVNQQPMKQVSTNPWQLATRRAQLSPQMDLLGRRLGRRAASSSHAVERHEGHTAEVTALQAVDEARRHVVRVHQHVKEVVACAHVSPSQRQG